MIQNIKRIGLGFALIGLVAANASAQVAVMQSEFDHDGRRYEIYEFVDGPKDWETAKTFTEGLDFMTVQGRLATITSFEEDEAVRLHVLDENTNESANLRELWIGGFQEPGSDEPVPGTTDPYDGWVWLNGEDIPAPGTYTSPPDPYENWDDNEPNNLGGEHHLAIGLGGNYGTGYGWNDEQALGNIDGFVVEYGDIVTVDPAECVSSTGCATLPDEAQTALFPEGTLITPGIPVDIRTFEFIDEDHGTSSSRCGVHSRTLFGPGSGPNEVFADVVVPAWLCGSPRFLVVFLDTDGIVEVPSGTVAIENEPLAALEDNLWECELPAGDQDLRHRDVVGWQSTLLEDMVEARFRTANPGLFAMGGQFEGLGDTAGALGTMGEFTDGCGSSRGRVRGSSYHIIGTHLHPADTDGASFDFIAMKFVELTQYKLALLQFSLGESKSVLKNGDFKKMQQQVKNAIKKVNKGNIGGATNHVRKFIKFAERANYDSGPGITNYNGEHLSRAYNILLMLLEKSAVPTP